MRRPTKPIDGEEVRKLAALGCTQDDIGGYFGVDQSTISRRFASEYALGASQCNVSLRRMQWKKARSGSTAMMIHLGKNHLGQSDKIEAKHDHRGSDDPDLHAAAIQRLLATAVDRLRTLGVAPVLGDAEPGWVRNGCEQRAVDDAAPPGITES